MEEQSRDIPKSEEMNSSASMPRRPLCVDMDGTLLRTDSLVECFVALLRRRPWRLLQIPFWLLRGRAFLKRQMAEHAPVDVDLFPFHEELLEFLQGEARSGRHLILATGADESIGRRVAAHFGIFVEVLGSDGLTNLTGRRKAALLVERYGRGGFDYAGNSNTDLAVWREAAGQIVVSRSAQLGHRVRQLGGAVTIFRASESFIRAFFRALRIHQWVKNVLIFIPVLAGHRLKDPAVVVQTLLAMAAFSLCASGIYVANDLHDIESDRRHPTKRRRPFASGHLSLQIGLALAPLLAAAGLLVGLACPPQFLIYLGIYLVAASAYSWALKRVVLLDVFVLAGLYTLRILAGHGATGIPYSSWLLGFSMFVFLSLALLKRYIELRRLASHGTERAAGRDYQAADAPGIYSLGATSGYLAVLVLALYINSEDVRLLYRQPLLLLFICPLLLYWVSRIWVLAARRQIDDDPVLFALKDKVSYLVGGIALLFVWLATVL
jgi:4-hydroxybenzoate polyprenyltransferase